MFRWFLFVTLNLVCQLKQTKEINTESKGFSEDSLVDFSPRIGYSDSLGVSRMRAKEERKCFLILSSVAVRL